MSETALGTDLNGAAFWLNPDTCAECLAIDRRRTMLVLSLGQIPARSALASGWQAELIYQRVLALDEFSGSDRCSRRESRFSSSGVGYRIAGPHGTGWLLRILPLTLAAARASMSRLCLLDHSPLDGGTGWVTRGPIMITERLTETVFSCRILWRYLMILEAILAHERRL